MEKTSLYRHFDASGTLLYVGVSHTHLRRMRQHQLHSSWYWDVVRIDVEHFPNRSVALRAEIRAIVVEKPLWNIAFKPEPMRILRLDPGGDPSEILAAFKAAQNVTHVRASRARPKKRKPKSE